MGLSGYIRVPAGEHESDCGDYHTDHAEDDLSREELLVARHHGSVADTDEYGDREKGQQRQEDSSDVESLADTFVLDYENQDGVNMADYNVPVFFPTIGMSDSDVQGFISTIRDV
ncbi:MAG: hypothetical protein SPF21_01765 [Candidatus Methanomethylophilaceae archaeon]|nr:hypothetical protein [Candidatus Methanomethylophilaceae archaeon]